jgi:hypothetical protein
MFSTELPSPELAPSAARLQERILPLCTRRGGAYAPQICRMFETKDTPKTVERALLVGAYTVASEKSAAQSLLEELEELVGTLGIPVIDRMLVFHREAHARLLLGSGKAPRSRIASNAKSSMWSSLTTNFLQASSGIGRS